MKQPKRHYKLGEEPHDEKAWQGGNIGPDVEVPEPKSTLGVKLYWGKVCVEHSLALLDNLDRLMLQQITPGQLGRVSSQLRAKLNEAKESLDKAVWHYDHDKLSDIGATIIE